MKILMAVGDGCARMVNPYVRSLAEGLRDAGHRVDVDATLFWNLTCDYDVVHVHWPQALFGWDLGGITAESVEKCQQRLEQLKSRGIAVCYTRHNVGPHANENPYAAELYRLFERRSDIVLHMGETSRRELSNGSEDDFRHVLVPHHVYDWYPSVEQAAARSRLKLGGRGPVVLSFGEFRTREERLMVARTCRDLGISGLQLLSPLLFVSPAGKRDESLFDEVRDIVRGHWPDQRIGRILDDQVPDYFSAADVVLLPRLDILNSGNLPLAYYFGKVVVGPDCGNVGEILKETGNPVFDPQNPSSAVNAVKRGLELAAQGKGAQNRSYAIDRWGSRKVVRELIAAYRTACDRKRPCVSVLMPSLNVARYVRESIDSVLGQTLRNIELICIDAGSTDGTREIIAEYAAGDSRVRILDSDVRSYGHQMNLGLTAARGRYVGIVEPDDYVARDMYETMYDKAFANNLDIIKGGCNAFVTDEGGRTSISAMEVACVDTDLCDQVVDLADHPESLRKGTLGTTLGLYRTDFLKEHGIRYNESPGASFQDTGFFFQTVICARRYMALGKGYYYYRQDNAGSSRNDRGRMMVLWNEYEFVWNVLARCADPQRMQVFRPFVSARDFSGQLWTVRRVGFKDAAPLIDRIREKFVPLLMSGELRAPHMAQADWNVLVAWARDTVTPGCACKVSVIMPCFNVAPYVSACLDSALSQTLGAIECVCVDDGSTDETLSILKSYAQRDSRVRVFGQKNLGVFEARNRALAEARGEFVAFMDPDDLYPASETLERLYIAAKRNGVLVAGGSLQSFLPNGSFQETEKPQNVFVKEGVRNYSDYQWPLGYQRFIYSRALLDRLHIRFPPFTRFQDPPFMAAAMIAAERFYAVPNVTYSYRISYKRPDWRAKDCLRFRDLLKALAMMAEQAAAADLSGLMDVVESELKAHLRGVVRPDKEMLASCKQELVALDEIISKYRHSRTLQPEEVPNVRSRRVPRAERISLVKLLLPYWLMRWWAHRRYGYDWPREGLRGLLPLAVVAVFAQRQNADKRMLKYWLPYAMMCERMFRVYGTSHWNGVPLDGVSPECPVPASGRRAWLPFGVILWLDGQMAK